MLVAGRACLFFALVACITPAHHSIPLSNGNQSSKEQNSTLVQQLRLLLETTLHFQVMLQQHETRLGELFNSSNAKKLQELESPDSFSPSFFEDCKDIFESGYGDSGVYDIWLFQGYRFLSVYCDMETTGESSGRKGWITIQRRINGEVNFNRRWSDYVNGFGFVDKEHWLGLENIYQLLGQRHGTGSFTLRIDLEDWSGITAFVEYNKFGISSKTYDYMIDSFGRHVGQKDLDDPIGATMFSKFSTFDHNRDAYRTPKCVKEQSGGWWFSQCWHWNLNGRYPEEGEKMTKDKMYIRRWDRVSSSNTALRYVSMKLQ